MSPDALLWLPRHQSGNPLLGMTQDLKADLCASNAAQKSNQLAEALKETHQVLGL